MNATLAKLPPRKRPSAPTDRELLRKKYDDYTEELYAAQTDEDIMESMPAATQRKITWDALDQVGVHYPDLHVFNELPVLYPRVGSTRLSAVVPDNMVCLYAGEIEDMASFAVELQEAKPFIMFEYVSRGPKGERKDYIANRKKYERDLKVPYYVLFHPIKKQLDVWYLNTRKAYSPVRQNKEGRYAIPELELEVAVHEGWARYWFRGKLLPKMREVGQSLDAAEKAAASAKQEATFEREARRLAEEKNRKLLERLRQLGADAE